MQTVVAILSFLNSPAGQAAAAASVELVAKGFALIEKLIDAEKAITAAAPKAQ